MRLAIIGCILLFLTGCQKVHYYSDVNINLWPTKILAHRAGGNSVHRENTISSASAALQLNYIDGVETDVQISTNHTIWMSHNTLVEDCNGEQQCFAKTEDSEIELIDSCQGKSIGYNKLEELFDYMKTNNLRKEVSIDMKSWALCSMSSLDIEGTMRFETEVIINLARKYNLEEYLLFESDIASVLNWVQKKSNVVKIYFLSTKNEEQAMLISLENNFTGISFNALNREKVTKEFIDLLHKKGLRFMAWGIQDEEQKKFLVAIGADYLQVDLY